MKLRSPRPPCAIPQHVPVVGDSFGVGYDFNTYRLEAALGPVSLLRSCTYPRMDAWTTALRKYRPFADGSANVSNRPFADLPDRSGYGRNGPESGLSSRNKWIGVDLSPSRSIAGSARAFHAAGQTSCCSSNGASRQLGFRSAISPLVTDTNLGMNERNDKMATRKCRSSKFETGRKQVQTSNGKFGQAKPGRAFVGLATLPGIVSKSRDEAERRVRRSACQKPRTSRAKRETSLKEARHDRETDPGRQVHVLASTDPQAVVAHAAVVIASPSNLVSANNLVQPH